MYTNLTLSCNDVFMANLVFTDEEKVSLNYLHKQKKHYGDKRLIFEFPEK